MSSETGDSLSSRERGVLCPSSRSDPPASSRFGCGTSTLSGIVANNMSVCDFGHDGDSTNSAGAGRTSGSTSQPAFSEDEVRRAKFASALHLSVASGGKSPCSPGNSSLSIDISRLSPMQDVDDDSSSKESDNEEEGASTSPHGGDGSSNVDSRRGKKVHRVLAEAASSPSLGSIDGNKRGTSPRSFNLQPRPNRHSSSHNESAPPNPPSSIVTDASADRSVESSCARPSSSFGRISPHLHLDLSCVAVPPLNATSSSHFETRCRSDSEATLGSNEICAAPVAAGMRQATQQTGAARPSVEPPPWAVAAKGEARLEVSYRNSSPVILSWRTIFSLLPAQVHTCNAISSLQCFSSSLPTTAGLRIAWRSKSRRSNNSGLLSSR